MIKLILIAVLLVALNEPVNGKIEEKFLKEDGYHFNLNLDDDLPCEDKCLGLKNSKKISYAVLYVIHANQFSYEVLTDLRIIDFLYDIIGYNEFSEHIKRNNFNYKGYDKLKVLVKRYRVCAKVCKVYSQFRKAVLENAADANLQEIINEDGTKGIKVSGELVILKDIIEDLQYYIQNNLLYKEIRIEAKTFVADVFLDNENWHGKRIIVKATTVMVPNTIVWDVSAGVGMYIFSYG